MTLYGDRDHFFSLKFNFGGAKKEDVYGFEENTEVYKQMFQGDPGFLMQGKDGPTSYVTQAGLQSRNARDYAMDVENPREQLTPSQVDLKNMNVVPPFNKTAPDLSKPYDFEPHDQVKLVQDATAHYLEQKDYFTDPKLFKKEYLNTDKVGSTLTGKSQKSLYNMRGNAAGKETYFLDDPSSGSNLASLETMYIF